MRIYLAGTITKDESTHIWREHVALALPDHVCLSPLRGEDVRTFTKDGLESNVAASIQVARDENDLKSADVVLLNVLGVETLNRQSIGTWAEFGLAHALGIPIVIIADHDSVLRHPFVKQWAAAVVPTVAEGVTAALWFADPDHLLRRNYHNN